MHSVTVDKVGEDKPNKTWQSSQGFHAVVSKDNHFLKFDLPHQLVPGDVLHHARWDKHLGLPLDHWDEITKFATMVLPSQPMHYKPIDLATWKKTNMQKRTRTATEMDGISKKDLLAMPDSLHEAIALLTRAETTAEWPAKKP
jgi:hypothetical protein